MSVKRKALAALFGVAIVTSISGQTLFQSHLVRDYREGQYTSPELSSFGVTTLERALYPLPRGDAMQIIETSQADLYLLPTISFLSWNSSHPYGDRDGALWQGRGVNSSITGGLFARGPWWAVTIAPEFVFAENRSFPLGPSGFAGNPYGHVATSIDLPQRMGNDVWTWIGAGQSEARLYWKDLTVGVGTQNLAVGPSVVNPIIMSENAPGFPHIDVGVLPTRTRIGWIESRLLWGRLQESVAYDTDPANDHTLLSLLTVNYRPVWFPMLTIGAYRTVAVNAQTADSRFIWQAIDPRPRGGNRDSGDPVYGTDEVDQMVAISIEIAHPDVGFRGYLEWAREDFASNLFSFIQIPYHSAAWTAGAEQRFLRTDHGTLSGLLEFTRTLQSRNYFLDGQYSSSFFYTHHRVRHGHTHAGQLLAAPAGPGTEGGTLRFRWVDDDYRVEFFFDRYAVNADYVFANAATLDRSNLDTEMGTGLALERDLNDFSLRLEGAFVNRRGFNYESALIRNNVWLAATVTYAP